MTEEMRVLTVRQPWAWAIIHGGKYVENRVRNIAGEYRGPVAIHVGLRWDPDEDGSVRLNSRQLREAIDTEGRIIGVVDLEEVHTSPECFRFNYEGEERFCSLWARDNSYHLVLAKPRALAKPIPFKGALGMRKLDPEMIARIEAQL